MPISCENFRALCAGEVEYRGISIYITQYEKGKYYSYKGTKFFIMISDFMAIGGDVVSNDGKGGMSKYGPTFKDENTFKIKADEKGLVGLYNTGPNSNNS